MSWRSGLFSAVLCLVLVIVCSFPADIQLCHAGDTECIKQSALQLISQSAKSGYPAAGFPVLEPYALKRFDISDGRSGALSLELKRDR